MPRVLLITYFYPPLQRIGAVRPMGLKKYLPRFGWECMVLTPRLEGAHRNDPDVIETEYVDVIAEWKRRLGGDHGEQSTGRAARTPRYIHTRQETSRRHCPLSSARRRTCLDYLAALRGCGRRPRCFRARRQTDGRCSALFCGPEKEASSHSRKGRGSRRGQRSAKREYPEPGLYTLAAPSHIARVCEWLH